MKTVGKKDGTSNIMPRSEKYGELHINRFFKMKKTYIVPYNEDQMNT